VSTSPPLYPVLPSAGPPKHWLPDATFIHISRISIDIDVTPFPMTGNRIASRQSHPRSLLTLIFILIFFRLGLKIEDFKQTFHRKRETFPKKTVSTPKKRIFIFSIHNSEEEKQNKCKTLDSISKILLTFALIL